jgi:methylmalonyl-CoA mutase cobalamin-binding subunit
VADLGRRVAELLLKVCGSLDAMDSAVEHDADVIPITSLAELDENEVKKIIESVKEAQYFDASSMAPLTPASLVCTGLGVPKRHI